MKIDFSENPFYDKIAVDSKQALIQLVSEAGHGKTSSLRTIIQYVRKKYPEIRFKIFDVCFDEKTEILTNKGWKKIKDVSDKEIVATLHESGEIQYQQITDKITSLSTEIYEYKGKTMNFSVTKNHKFLVKKRYRRQRTGKDIIKTEIKTAKQLYEEGTGNRTYIPRTGLWRGIHKEYFVLPKYDNQAKRSRTIKPERVIPMNDWLFFFGLYLAEGSSTGKTTQGNSNTVSMDQKIEETEKLEEMKKSFEHLPFGYKTYDYISNPYKTEMRSFRVHDVQLASYLKQFGNSKQKYIPRWIFDLPTNQLKHLYEGMMIGDGSKNKYKKSYATSSKRLANDFQELIFKLGKFANIRENALGKYSVIISDKKQSMVIKNNFTKKQEIKPVYCVTVPNHTIYVRRNGQPFWSMNSQAWYHNAPTQWRQLVTMQKLQQSLVENLDDCVYEMGSLSGDMKRAFVGTILMNDWNKRYQAKLDGNLEDYPLIAYVFEESNIYFGSYALRRNDQFTPVFQNFVSVGRNYKMRGFLVATAEQGEMSPSLRRRTRKIYGKILGKADLLEAKRNGCTADLTKIPRYHFYYDGIIEHIPDAVQNTPTDYIPDRPIREENTNFDSSWWIKFIGTIIIFFLFWAWLMNY